MSRATLNPELLWIGGDYCYRLNPLSDAFSSAPPQPSSHQASHLRPVGQLEEEAAAGDESNGGRDEYYGASGVEAATCRSTVNHHQSAATSECDEIEEQLAGCRIDTDRGGYRMQLPVPSAFYGFLIGRHGDAKRRLEAETGAELRIPRMGDTESPVLVFARGRAQLASAKTRIELLLAEARDRLPITHFLSVCLASEEVQTRYAEFRDSALKWCGGDRGIVEEVFQGAARLHITCAPLLLLTAQEVAKAKRLLEEFGRDLLPELMRRGDGGPLNVSLRGLEIMNDDPSSAKVLYAKLHEPTGRLQAIADALAVQFASLARAQPGRQGVKLHVTLMNAKYTISLESGSQRNPPVRSFDAAHLLTKFSDYNFGTCSPDCVQLSKSSAGTSKDSYYACESKIALL